MKNFKENLSVSFSKQKLVSFLIFTKFLPMEVCNIVYRSNQQVENDNIENGVQIVTSAETTTPVNQRVTTPYLTKYERARILGTRALQLRYIFMSN